MKKFLTLFVATLASVASWAGIGSTTWSGYGGVGGSVATGGGYKWCYTKSSGNAIRLTGFDDGDSEDFLWTAGISPLPSGSLVVPSSFGDLVVLAIDHHMFSYCSSLTSVTLSEGIGSIDGSAFYRCSNLKTLNVPSTCYKLPSKFADCSSLQSINVAAENPHYLSVDGVVYTKDMQQLVFLSESKTDFVIPPGMTELPKDFIKNHLNLTRISVAAGNSSYTLVDDVVYDAACTKLIWCPRTKTSLTMPSSVTEVCDYACYQCDKLTSVTLSSNLKKIGVAAFKGCSKMDVADMPSSIDYVSDSSFYDCSLLTKAILAPGVSDLDSYDEDLGCRCGTYGGWCLSITSLFVHGDVEEGFFLPYPEYQKISEITFRDDVTTIQASAYQGYTGLRKAIFQGNCPKFLDNAAGGIPNSCAILVSLTSQGWGVDIPGQWKGHDIGYSDAIVVTFDIGNNATRSGGGALRQILKKGSAAQPPELSLAAGWRFVGWDCAFSDCREDLVVKAVYERLQTTYRGVCYTYRIEQSGVVLTGIGENVVEIEEMPSTIDGMSVVGFDERMFRGNAKIRSVVVGFDIPSRAFSDCSALENVTIKEGVKTIGFGAFARCTALATISLPSTLKTVGELAFADCRSVKRLNLADMAAYCNAEYAIDHRSQEDDDGYDSTPLSHATSPVTITCKGETLTTLTIPEGVRSIPYYAFQGANVLAVVLPSSVKSIGSEAFADCRSLKSVYVSSIESWFGISGLGRLTYWGGVCQDYLPLRDGGRLYLNGQPVVDLVVPEGVEYLDDYFLASTSIKTVSLPSSLRDISYLAFGSDNSRLPALSTITFAGNAPYVRDDDYDSRDRFVADIPNATIRVSQSSSGWNVAIPGTWKGLPIDYLQEGVLYAFSVANGEATIGTGTPTAAISTTTEGALVIPSVLGGCPVTTIGDCAFRECNKITSVTIPESVTKVTYSSFYAAEGLSAINVAASNLSYCSIDGILYTKDRMRLVVCPGAKASAVIPNGVSSIAEGAFYYCSALASVSIPEGVEAIEDWTFAYCPSLSEVALPESVTRIGASAFSGDNSLTTITIHKAVTTIGESAFFGCSQLKTVCVDTGDTARVKELMRGKGVAVDKLTFDDPALPDGGPYVETVDGVNWTFRVVNGEATIGADDSAAIPTTTKGALVVPSVLGGHAVTAIDYGAFRRCTHLVSVKIPSCIREVCGDVFYGCRSLQVVYAEKGDVARIRSLLSDPSLRVGSLCSQDGFFCLDEVEGGVVITGVRKDVESVLIPSQIEGKIVQEIASEAFAGCDALKVVFFPEEVITLQPGFADGVTRVVVYVPTIEQVAYTPAVEQWDDVAIQGALDWGWQFRQCETVGEIPQIVSIEWKGYTYPYDQYPYSNWAEYSFDDAEPRQLTVGDEEYNAYFVGQRLYECYDTETYLISAIDSAGNEFFLDEDLIETCWNTCEYPDMRYPSYGDYACQFSDAYGVFDDYTIRFHVNKMYATGYRYANAWSEDLTQAYWDSATFVGQYPQCGQLHVQHDSEYVEGGSYWVMAHIYEPSYGYWDEGMWLEGWEPVWGVSYGYSESNFFNLQFDHAGDYWLEIYLNSGRMSDPWTNYYVNENTISYYVSIAPLEIAPSNVVCTAGDHLVYNGDEQWFSYDALTLETVGLPDRARVRCFTWPYETGLESCTAVTNAGVYSVGVRVEGDYQGEVSIPVYVDPREISKARIELAASSLIYSEPEHRPAVSVVDEGLATGVPTQLLENKDYTLSYSNNENVGEAVVRITGCGNYTGVVERTFTITPAKIVMPQDGCVTNRLGAWDFESGLPWNGGANYGAIDDDGVDSESFVCAYADGEPASGRWHLSVDSAQLVRFPCAADLRDGVVTVSARVMMTASEDDPCWPMEPAARNVRALGIKPGDGLINIIIRKRGFFIGVPGRFCVFPYRQEMIDGERTDLAILAGQQLWIFDGTEGVEDIWTDLKMELSQEGVSVYLGERLLSCGEVTRFPYLASEDTRISSFAVKGTGKIDDLVISQAETVDFGWRGVYDGRGHGLAVDVVEPTNALVRCALAAEGPFVDDLLFTNVCNRTVWYEVSAPNYSSVTGCAQVAIAPRSLEDATVVFSLTNAWAGAAVCPQLEVTDERLGRRLQEGVDYAVHYTDNTRVGTAWMWLEGLGNYCGALSRSYEIVKGRIVAPDPRKDIFGWSAERNFEFDGATHGVWPLVASDVDEVSISVSGVTNGVSVGSYEARATGIIRRLASDGFYDYVYETPVNETVNWWIEPGREVVDGVVWRFSPVDGGVMLVCGESTRLTGNLVVPTEVGGFPVVALGEAVFEMADDVENLFFMGDIVPWLQRDVFANDQARPRIWVPATWGLTSADFGGRDVRTYPTVSITPGTSVVTEGRVALVMSHDGVEGVTVVRYTTDGHEPTAESAVYGTRFSVRVTGLVTVKAAVFVGERRVSEIAQVQFAPTLTEIFDANEILTLTNSAPIVYNTGSASWRIDETSSADGTPAMRSAAIAHNQESWLSASFSGRGVFEFCWKSSCEEDELEEFFYDHAVCYLDGRAVQMLDGRSDWMHVTLPIDEDGAHVVKWVYVKDRADPVVYLGEDCAWVDAVRFSYPVYVSFDCGGAGGPETIMSALGCEIRLPEDAAVDKACHAFVGWTDGKSVYQPGDAYVVTGEVSFVAVWKTKVLASPVIDVVAEYDAETTEVMISGEDGEATIVYTIDGSEPNVENGLVYSGKFEVAGTTTIKAIAVRDDWFDSDIVEKTTVRSWGTLNKCLDNDDLVFTTGGDANWFGTAEESYSGGTSARSGAITHDQSSWIETKVNGPGTLTYAIKVESEYFEKRGQITIYDGVTLLMDSAKQELIGGNIAWMVKALEITGEGEHSIRWVYAKDDVDEEWCGRDRVWLDAIVWTPHAQEKDAIVVTDPNEKVTLPSGARVEDLVIKIMVNGVDVRPYLELPTPVDGILDLSQAVVKPEIQAEPLDPSKGARIQLSAANPSITTAATKKGLTYQLKEGTTLESMIRNTSGDTKVGDGLPWTPRITVKDGQSGFYTIEVRK